MPSAHARERALAWTLIGATTLVAVVASADAWRRVGSITPGFNLMANLQIDVGDRGGVEPFGQIRAVDGQPVRSHAELRALVEARPVGTVLRYAIERDGRSEERAVPSRQVTLRDLKHFLIDSLLPGLLTLMIAAAVTVLRPDAAEGRLFQGFCLISSLVQVVERCFGAFLDEILERGGDVNETAGDGLMVIFPRDLGEHQLKNVDVPVRVFGLGHEESSPPSALRLA